VWVVHEILDATKGHLTGKPAEVSVVSTDSRTIGASGLFVALTGDRFDGHDFVEAALQHGAAGALVSRTEAARRHAEWGKWESAHFFIGVDDPLLALQQMAAWHRRRFSIPLIGVTGSNGKTTTKEMIASILNQRGAAMATRGNLNNHIGLPLSLLTLTPAHWAGVVEIGINHLGEMAPLCEIAQPTVGLVTNVGPAHLEFLGSVEGVAREKGVLLDTAPCGIVNLDDPLLRPWAKTLPQKWTYTVDNCDPADVTVSRFWKTSDGMAFHLYVHRKDCGEVTLATVGRHQLSNALAATAATLAIGCMVDEVRAGLAAWRPGAMRMERRKVGDVDLLLEAYNANPASMKAALSALAEIASGRKVALLGDMLELGEASATLHFQVGEWAGACGVDRLVAVGQWAKSVADGATAAGVQAVSVYPTLAALEADLRSVVRPGDTVLIKGSRGMKMETLLPALEHHQGASVAPSSGKAR
jgi:UDP-N-acetylmuramoyl-tripeptide--D-alanyl-D-alanine ligase